MGGWVAVFVFIFKCYSKAYAISPVLKLKNNIEKLDWHPVEKKNCVILNKHQLILWELIHAMHGNGPLHQVWSVAGRQGLAWGSWIQVCEWWVCGIGLCGRVIVYSRLDRWLYQNVWHAKHFSLKCSVQNYFTCGQYQGYPGIIRICNLECGTFYSYYIHIVFILNQYLMSINNVV